jgi:glycosyltransferase involved in cell wall biosynthesis
MSGFPNGIDHRYLLFRYRPMLSIGPQKSLVALNQRLIAWLVKKRQQSRIRRGVYRTLWGVTPILTLPVLARCDRLLGLHSKSLVFVTYYITKNFDINLRFLDLTSVRLARFISGAHQKFRWLVLIYVATNYDAVSYFYDRGILLSTERFGIPEAEIAFLFGSGVRIYTYAYGADVRTRQTTLALGPVNVCTDCPEPGRFCICSEEDLKLSLSRLDRRVAARIAVGDMLAYVPNARNMHYWPLDLSRLKATPCVYRTGRPLRIAHAPNHSHFKGTHHLFDAVSALRAEGYAVEVVEISGVPNARVLELFESADLVADQFIAGFHGYTALEAMALGRAVLCFLRGPEMTIAPEECPIINTPPALVKQTLKRILDGDIDLTDLGCRSRQFIERYYSLEAVAVRLGHLYLETADLPEAVSARVKARVSELEKKLPTISSASPPVPWDLAVSAARVAS